MEKPILLIIEADDEGAAHESHYLESVAAPARDRGLIGDVRVARANAESFSDALGRLDKNNLIIAKGMVETEDFARLILKYNNKELIAGGKDGLLSHCTIILKEQEPPRPRGRADAADEAAPQEEEPQEQERPLILADAAINITPDAGQKVKIVKNAIDLARLLFDVERPVVSILTPSGKLNPKIQSSVDGDCVIRQLKNENAEIRLDQMDTAIDAESRAAKKLPGGTADILLVDNLDVGNIIYKMYTKVGKYDAAGLVCGSAVPIVLNSRADSPRSKILSIEYALRLMAAKCRK
jgi:hypothetical protein